MEPVPIENIFLLPHRKGIKIVQRTEEKDKGIWSSGSVGFG